MDDTLSSRILSELGLPAVQAPMDVPVVQTRVSANLPAVPEHVPGIKRVIGDLIDLATITDPDTDREAARDRKRDQLVTGKDGRGVHIAPIIFEPSVQKNGDVHAVGWYSNLPGIPGNHKILPLIYVGPEYLKPIANGKFISGGTFQCLLFRSFKNRRVFRALPLGLADPKTITEWNEIVMRRNAAMGFKDRPWAKIEIIPHKLREPGVRQITFIPRFDLHADLVSESSKRQLLGCHFGQKVYLAPKATIPELDTKDGVKGFFSPHLFRVKKLQTHLEVVWLGNENDVPLQDHIDMEEAEIVMDPFETLQTTPIEVDWKNVDQLTRIWVKRSYDDKNPLYRQALKLGLVYEADPLFLKRTNMEQLWSAAVKQIRIQMIDACKQAHHILEMAGSRPSALEIMGKQTDVNVVAQFLNEPKDAAALWIGHVLNCTFNPESPFHMHLRTAIVNKYVRPSGKFPTAIAREPSEISVEIPERTPVLPAHLVPSASVMAPTHRRESSHPIILLNPEYIPPPTQDAGPHIGNEIELESEDLEEIDVTSEPTLADAGEEELDFPPGEFTRPHAPLPHESDGFILPPEDQDPPPRFFAKPGSLLHQGSLKDGYRDD